MVSYRVHVLLPDARVSRRVLSRAHRAGLHAAGVKWHELFLPRHFADGAQGRYGYDPRSARYAGFKRKTGRGPLEWSGGLRRASAAGEVRASNKRVRVIMRGLPDYIRDGGGLTASKRDAAVLRIEAAIAKALAAGEAPSVLRRMERSLQRLLTARVVARYPDIRRELVVTTEGESKVLTRIYDGTAGAFVRREMR